MSKKQNFKWKTGEPLPGIEAHTERKLEVIEQYLDVYFDTVTANRRMETLRITIVDGFCGGGLYQKGTETRYGSPFALLNAVKQAKIRVNAERHKPLEIIAHYYFSDSNKLHMAALREELLKSEFASQVEDSIILQTGQFEALLPKVITDIKKRQRQGRSFFVLDQWGYVDVPRHCLQQIFTSLDKPEAILTFSIDALLNYLRTDGSGLDGLRQFGVSEEFVSTWQSLKEDENFGRATAQRTVMETLRSGSGAHFFTPFMMFSKTDNRWMLLAHLSKHQAARDKMLSVHWDSARLPWMGRACLLQVERCCFSIRKKHAWKSCGSTDWTLRQYGFQRPLDPKSYPHFFIEKAGYNPFIFFPWVFLVCQFGRSKDAMMACLDVPNWHVRIGQCDLLWGQ